MLWNMEKIYKKEKDKQENAYKNKLLNILGDKAKLQMFYMEQRKKLEKKIKDERSLI